MAVESLMLTLCTKMPTHAFPDWRIYQSDENVSKQKIETILLSEKRNLDDFAENIFILQFTISSILQIAKAVALAICLAYLSLKKILKQLGSGIIVSSI